MSGKNQGVLNLENMTKLNNNADLETAVLSREIPRGEVYLLKNTDPFNLFITTREEYTPSSSGEKTIILDNDIVDSAALGDSETVIICKQSDQSVFIEVDSVNYADNEITATFADTDPVYIYYLFSEGNVSIDVIPPWANGSASINLYKSSLRKIHSSNQFNARSMLYLKRSMLVPENYKIQVRVDSPVVAYFHPDNEVADCEIDYYTQPIEKWLSQGIDPDKQIKQYIVNRA